MEKEKRERKWKKKRNGEEVTRNKQKEKKTRKKGEEKKRRKEEKRKSKEKEKIAVRGISPLKQNFSLLAKTFAVGMFSCKATCSTML